MSNLVALALNALEGKRVGVQPVQPPEVPEYSAGYGLGSDPVRTRFRCSECSGCSAGCLAGCLAGCSACLGVQHVFSVFKGGRSVQPVCSSGSGCSGDGSEGINEKRTL